MFKVDNILVHVGLAKSGTTVLQETLSANRDKLIDDYGILYPSPESNHFHFQTAFSRAPAQLIQARREGLFTPEDAAARGKGFIASFDAEVQATKPRTVIISSEYFSAMDEEELAGFVKFLTDRAQRVKAIAYVRDPWSFSTSIIQQMIRDGALSAPVKLRYVQGQVELVKKFEAAFTSDALTVRPYIASTTFRTDVIEDFCDVIGVDPTRFVQPEHPAGNESIDRLRATLLAEFNTIWPQYDETGLFVLSNQRDMVLGTILGLDINDRRIGLSHNQAKRLHANAASDIDYLEKNHFGGQPIFSRLMSEFHFDTPEPHLSFRDLNAADLREICYVLMRCLSQSNIDAYARAVNNSHLEHGPPAAEPIPEPEPETGKADMELENRAHN